jgi:membrane protease YdiL (CAAX protease family)
MLRWGRVAAAYLLLGVFALVAAVFWRGGVPFVHPEPWLALPPKASHTYSLLLGLAVGASVVMGTRHSVARYAWARELHAALRPFARGLTSPAILWLALLSAAGEELMFRGLLQPSIGIWAQAIIFGLVHQLPGPSRWVWVSWASVMGVVLGGVYQLTGSLIGCIAAHALVNGLNLAYLRSHDPSGRRSLGGLLGEQPNP